MLDSGLEDFRCLAPFTKAGVQKRESEILVSAERYFTLAFGIFHAQLLESLGEAWHAAIRAEGIAKYLEPDGDPGTDGLCE